MESPDPAPPKVLSPEAFRLIGSTLNGDHWQADVARLIGCSKSQVTRYLNGTRNLTPLVAQNLQYVLVQRILALVDMMDIPGMPYADHPDLAVSRDAIESDLEPFPGQEPVT